MLARDMPLTTCQIGDTLVFVDSRTRPTFIPGVMQSDIELMISSLNVSEEGSSRSSWIS
jgi:hypothetical protein